MSGKFSFVMSSISALESFLPVFFETKPGLCSSLGAPDEPPPCSAGVAPLFRLKPGGACPGEKFRPPFAEGGGGGTWLGRRELGTWALTEFRDVVQATATAKLKYTFQLCFIHPSLGIHA